MNFKKRPLAIVGGLSFLGVSVFSFLFIEKNIEDSFLISFENNSYIQIEYSEISNWLQKRNYKLVNDKIYYNNQVYASFSEKWFNNNFIYGRLKNNYIIIPVGKSNSPSEFAIRPFDGDNELILKLHGELVIMVKYIYCKDQI